MFVFLFCFETEREVTKKHLVSLPPPSHIKCSSGHLFSGLEFQEQGAQRSWWAMSASASSINLVSLPLLLLSHYMKVIMTPSSIILLSLLFSWNCLIICYRFVSTHIILPVICSISSCKHTAHSHWPLFEDYCQWHLQDAFGIWSIICVAMGNYADLSVIAKSTTSESVLMQR